MVRHVDVERMLERYAKLVEDPLLYECERDELRAELMNDLGPRNFERISRIYSAWRGVQTLSDSV